MEPPGAPALHAWAAGDRPLRLVEQPVAKDDPDRKARACYGVLRRRRASMGGSWGIRRRSSADGRPGQRLRKDAVFLPLPVMLARM